MQREIILTSDGSHTVQIKDMDVTYHSHHGAIQESMHVFIEAGFLFKVDHRKDDDSPIRIFEMGFGAGLNAYLTLLEAKKTKTKVVYTTIENFPLQEKETRSFNYPKLLNAPVEEFQKLHKSDWSKYVSITENFRLQKIKADLIAHSFEEHFDVIYYDAFAPKAQPELWTAEVFKKIFRMLLPGGILVTYCSKGDVRRAMMAAGFSVEKIPGPRGKREMVRAGRSL